MAEQRTSSNRSVTNQPSKSALTRIALMRAAEQVIADKGLEKLTIRDITSAAGQKNESALQYHFKNLKGLITELHKARNNQIREKRAELLEALLAESPTPPLRALCRMMVAPAFELASSQPDFRRYIKAFGHELIVSDESALKMLDRKGGASGRQTGSLLRAALPHLDGEAYRARMDSAIRLAAASMYHQARQPNGFRGATAALFFSRLIDGLEGLLSAPESARSQELAAQVNAGENTTRS